MVTIATQGDDDSPHARRFKRHLERHFQHGFGRAFGAAGDADSLRAVGARGAAT